MDFDDYDHEGDIDLSDEFEALNGSNTRTLVPEKRLSSPITTGLLQRVLDLEEGAATFYNWPERWRTGKFDDRARLVREYLRVGDDRAYSSITKPCLQYCDMLDRLTVRPTILEARAYPHLFKLFKDKRTGIESDYSAALESYNVVRDAYLTYIGDCVKPEEYARMKRSLAFPKSLPLRLHRSSQHAALWDSVVEGYRRHYNSAFRAHWKSYGPVKCIFGTGFALMMVTEKTSDLWNIPFLATYEQLQMIQDCTLGRHSIETALAIRLHNGSDKLAHYTDLVFRWQEKCLLTYGNDGYELVKAPEAIFKTRLNSLTDGDVLSISSYDRTVLKIRDKELKLGGNGEVTARLHKIALSVTSLADCVELFGLAKMSGHPTVYAERSAASVREEAMPQGTATVYHSRMLVRMFKHITLSAYLEEHSEWPPLSVRPLLNSKLRQLFNQRVTTLPLNSYPLSDLDNLEFGKFVEFDYSEDYLKFLDDKAISPGAKALPSFWFGGETGESRRLLEKICKIPHLDTRAMVERLRKGKTTRDEEVVELTQKERELKTAARCFCKLPLQVRCFFTLTEYNLGEYFMKKYFPQQTMTMASSEVKRRLYNLVRTSKNKDRVLLEVDFSRWNLRWRANTVDPVAFCLESIFGLDGVFSQAHRFFERATVVLTDKHSLPTGARKDLSIHSWPESSLLWRGHKGGFEGIQQKLWTICTICMMYVVMYDAEASFMMAGQGDNQVFAIKFNLRPGESLRDKLTKLLGTMQVRCWYLNHEVKPDECIDSATVLTYSKDVYVLGVHKLYSLKFVARTLKVENLDVPSLSKELSGVSATSVMIADCLQIPFRGFFWQCFQVLRLMTSRETSPNHIEEKEYNRRLFRGSAAKRQFALLLAGSLGGLPLQSWGRFFMKGEVDELGWDVAASLKLYKACPSLGRDMKLLLEGKYSPESPNLRSLILDPHSIPLMRPEDAIRMIKQSISNELPTITYNGNKWIHQIVSAPTESAGESLLQALANTSPLYPQIMSDIYAYSPAGVRESLLNRFNMTKTITAMTGNKSFLTGIQTSNCRLLQYVVSRYENTAQVRTSNFNYGSAFKVCTTLRSLWGKSVEHRNIGTYCPLDMPLIKGVYQGARITCMSRTPIRSFLDDVGVYPPNFGTSTRAKIGDHGIKVITSSTTVGDIRALLITHSEIGRSPYLAEHIDRIIRARTPWSLRALEGVFPSVYGGTAAHRHDALQSSHFSTLSSRTVPTHLNFSSDHSGYLAGGSEDYPFVFQEAYLLLTQVCQQLVATGSDECAYLSLALPEKMEPLTDSTIKQADPTLVTPPAVWPDLRGNLLTYVSKLQFKTLPDVPDADLFEHIRQPKEVRGLIMSYLLSSTRNKKMSIAQNRIASLYPIEILDVAEFINLHPRDVVAGAAAYTAIESVFYAFQIAGKSAPVELPEILLNVATSVASPLVRMFLLQSAMGERYSDEIGLVLHPGSAGAPHATRQLAGEISKTAAELIHGHMLTCIPGYQLYLFEDKHSASNHVLLKYCVYWLATTHWKASLKLTFLDRTLITASQVRAGISGTSMQAAQSTYRTCLDLLRHGKRDKSAYSIEKFTCKFVLLAAKEAIRFLRGERRGPRIECDSLYIKSVLYSSKLGQVSFSTSDEIGTVMPHEQHELYQRTPAERKLDLILSHLRRPLGKYSSAVSVWAAIMPAYRHLIRGKEVMAVGVGHGATARILLELDAATIRGVDLRDSFPVITQREDSYHPPEIAHHPARDRFSWTSSTLLGLSDFCLHSKHIIAEYHCDFIVLDIETVGPSDLFRLNQSERCIPYLCRCFLTDDDVSWVIDVCRPQAVYRLDERRGKSGMYIIHGITNGVEARSGNYLRTQMRTTREFRPRYARRLTPFTEIINDMIRPFGLEVESLDLGELATLPSRLKRILHNLNERKLIDECREITTLISELRPAVHDTPAACASRLFNLDARLACQVARYLACTRTDIDDVARELSTYDVTN